MPVSVVTHTVNLQMRTALAAAGMGKDRIASLADAHAAAKEVLKSKQDPLADLEARCAAP
jgi:hypothetical protein